MLSAVLLLAALPAADSSWDEPQRFQLVFEPGPIARPSITTVRAFLPASEIEGSLTDGPGWYARMTGDGVDRTVQTRIDEERNGLEIFVYDYTLKANEEHERELLLHRKDPGDRGYYRVLETEGATSLFGSNGTQWRVEHADWDKENHERTFRPFTHLYAPGNVRLTKGPGGLYPHHRGVFCGWSKTRVGEATHNFWYVPAVERPHQKHMGFRDAWTGPLMGTVTEDIDWISDAGEVIVKESRTTTSWSASCAPDWPMVFHEYTVTLRAAGDEPVELDGDAAHAGFQLRLDQSVAEEKACRYLFPEGAVGEGNDNWRTPWVAATFPMEGKEYEVLFMDHPENPHAAVFNTRDYGRFGAFFQATLKPGKPLVQRYAIRIRPVLVDHAYEPLVDHMGEFHDWVHPVKVRWKD